ncbi:MAG: ATP-binding protein, partial [Spirochaetaceae bacterium]|nr:ATP-binding protein [Spirochaetaceae bacterium]
MINDQSPKRFCTTGLCVPGKHYMVDTSERIRTIIGDYIDRGDYFTINRARQFGKTTTLNLLRRNLVPAYIVFSLSFEGMGDELFDSNWTLFEGLRRIFMKQIEEQSPELSRILAQQIEKPFETDDFRQRVTKLCTESEKPVVLLIDEIDKAPTFEPFLRFLGLLRDMFMKRQAEDIPTFQSVILAGVHDIKNLKNRIRPEEEHRYYSPWNIAVNFDMDMSFHPEDIATMLADYEADHHTEMDIPAVSQRIYYWTNGYPFLVSRTCQMIDDVVRDSPHEALLTWDANGVDEAVKDIISTQKNLLFDDMVKNLISHPDLDALTRQILLSDIEVPYALTDVTQDIGMMYGIYAVNSDRKIVISNKIFATTLLNHYSAARDIREKLNASDADAPMFIHDGILDMETVLKRFGQFMKSEYRDEDSDFIEREGRLLFLSFLRPIINGKGNYAVESETRGSRRMDIVVFYGGKEYIIELKIWRGESYEANGMAQLAEYLKGKDAKRGWLLSFANLQKSPREG